MVDPDTRRPRRPWRETLLAVTTASVVLASSGCPHRLDGDDDDDSTAGPDYSEQTNIEVIPLDIWGFDLTEGTVVVRVDGAIAGTAEITGGPVVVPWDDRGAFEVEILDAGEFIGASTTLTWVAGAEPDSLSLTQPDASSGARALHAFEQREVGGTAYPVATVVLGLDHTWFAATGRPARGGNDLQLLMDGEQAWATIHADLVTATDRIDHSVWYWESDFELVRDEVTHVTSTETQRWNYASLEVLESLGNVDKKLLINRFYDSFDWIDMLYVDSDLLDHAEQGGDRFEVILHANGTDVPLTTDYEGEPADFCFRDRVLANPAYADLDLLDPPCVDGSTRDPEVPAASWHQKFWLVDDKVAYVGGMNTKGADWDTSDHLVFEPRRMTIDADTDDRQAVQAHEQLPDYGPRKDYVMRIDGPCFEDVEDVFETRWTQAIADGAAYSEHASAYEPTGYSGGEPGTLQAQVAATMPEPWAEMSILESMSKAFAAAESYIYIEDQYFRAPTLNESLIATLLDKPWVKLIVVTKPVTAYDGGAMYTYISDHLFRDLVPDQYLMLQLQSFEVVAEEGTFWDTRDLYLQPMDVHSKIVIVDDVYLSVGSANKNNRSMLYDGELNVAVLDETFVRDQRERIFANLVGPERADDLTDDADHNFELLRDIAENNDELAAAWEVWIDDLSIDTIQDYAASYRPEGFVYTLEIPPDYWFEVGPDVTSQ